MRVLGILGSPRRGGNSEVLLDKALEGAESCGFGIEKIVLNELNFLPCQECGGCAESGKCVIDDDMRIVYKKVDEAGAIILAAPIFFGSLPAQVKAMVDRYQCRWIKRQGCASGSKKGLLILVSAANREDFFKNAESIVKNFFAVLDIKFAANLYCPNLEKKAKVSGQQDSLRQAFELGRRMGAN